MREPSCFVYWCFRSSSWRSRRRQWQRNTRSRGRTASMPSRQASSSTRKKARRKRIKSFWCAERRSKPSAPNVPIPADAKIIDLSKSTVLPGLFDAHTHLCMTLKKDRDGNSYYITTLLDPTPYRAIEGVANARDMLAAGFTTVRDVGNTGNYADTALREAIERGLVPGPTMINAGRIIAPYGGQFQLQPEKRDLATPEYAFADTHDEMIKAIRENIHYGATVIKIVVDDQKYIYSADDIRFMVEEAHRDGLKLAAHCWTRAGAHNAAEAGVDSIEHGEMMTNEDLQLAKKNHVVLVGTDFTESAAREDGFPELARRVRGPAEARLSDWRDDGVRHRRVRVRARRNARDAGGGICRLLGRSGRARERHFARDDDQCGAPARRRRASAARSSRASPPTSSPRRKIRWTIFKPCAKCRS